MNTKILLIISAVSIVLLGSGLGLLLSQKSASKVEGTSTQRMINTPNEVGSTDTKTFRDSAQGKLEKGGMGNVGTHKLVLDSNPKNAVYLVSSVVDLDQFEGKHIEVWGETNKSSSVSWLMDVGRVKLLE